MPLLTKSKYMQGLRCKKLLWYSINKKIPDPSDAELNKMEAGTEAGVMATKVFPEGIKIQEDDFMQNIKETEEAIKKKQIIFEAGIKTDTLFSRADILKPNGDQWDIIEVKSSTEVKPEYIQDVSFQKYCYEQAGLKIKDCYLMHINNQYVRKGEIEPDKLFAIENISEQVEEEIKNIQTRIDGMLEIFELKEPPETKIGMFCNKPHECPMKGPCWGVQSKDSVFNLYRGGKKSFELFHKGITEIGNIPEGYKLTKTQQVQLWCEKQGKEFIDTKAINDFLQTLEYPLYYLDFETFASAIPVYDNLKPYQRVPFQYSLHIQEKEGAELKHISFLSNGKEDSRKDFMKSLKDNLGDKGSIVVYNQGFEQGVIKEQTELFPEYEGWTEKINTRFVDLLVPFRNFSYYNPDQVGSASIKKVLPVLTNLSYSDLDIGNGEQASNTFLDVVKGRYTQEEVNKIRKDLEIYCALDTEAMILLIDALNKVK